jgi:hypothetical protein
MAISKKTLYTIFILKFFFSISLIFWTIKITLGAGVGSDDDNSFLSDYKTVNENYNKIVEENKLFNSKYIITAIINEKTIDNLSYKDIFLSQRNIKQRTKRKNILNNGTNVIKLLIKDKMTNKIIDKIDANIAFTRPSTHNGDIKFKINRSNKSTTFNIDAKAYWNIMGEVKIKDNIGHFYIKTNSK